MPALLSIMKFYVVILVIALSALTLSSAIPKPADDQHKEHKNRVFDKELSDEEHFKGEEHNSEYDHEAFVGKDEARTFDELSPEESKKRLAGPVLNPDEEQLMARILLSNGISKAMVCVIRLIYDKIDKDNDNFVTETELKEWIKFVQNRYIMDDTERQWKEHEESNGVITWDSYKKRTYGYLDNEDDNAEEDEDDGYSYKDMIRRDEKRWKKADTDEDGNLSKEEFANFLHPEEAEHMREIVVEETLDDIDKDKDGKISLEEYIGDMYDLDEEEGEPDWVKSEREQFLETRDMNKDGFMDQEEIAKWILPEDYDHIKAESEHLLREADGNKDGKLSKEEVLEQYALFVGSQATDFGEYLSRHDEF